METATRFRRCVLYITYIPTFANIYLSYHKNRLLDGCPSEFKPVLCFHYVDDCLISFRKNGHISMYHDYLNSKHVNIKFTVEIEQDNSLPFLDYALKNLVMH